MMNDFCRIGTWLTSNYTFSFFIGTYVREVTHSANAAPATVLDLAYPRQIGRIVEIYPIGFEVIEWNVMYMYEAAVKNSNNPPRADELADRRDTVLSELKTVCTTAVGVYEFEFDYDRSSGYEWVFNFLFLGNEHSWVIRGDAIWT